MVWSHLYLGKYLGHIWLAPFVSWSKFGYDLLSMRMEIVIIAGVVLAGVGLYVAVKKFRSGNKINKLSPEQREKLSQEIEQGIIYEDQFVDTYYNMIRNEGYMFAFGGHKKQAHDLLFNMIEESKAHKISLLNIKKQLEL